jgi:transposase
MGNNSVMNQLKMSQQQSIITLWQHGWSFRRIARELQLRRETVSKYVRQQEAAVSKPAIPLTGSAAEPEVKAAISLAGSLAAGRQSLCLPLRAVIASAVQAGLSAQRIYQDWVGGHQFAGSYHSVQRFVRQLRQTQPVPFVRMEVEPGLEAQVDFGLGAWVLVEGRRKRPHLFRLVLSHSRKAYSEVVWRQTTESFIRCLENAFRYFGGVPKTLVIDNLRAAVTRTDWYDPELNAKVAEFCRHYNTAMLPTRPARPQHKGKIEAGVKFAQNNALKGRSFNSLAEQNLFLAEWEWGKLLSDVPTAGAIIDRFLHHAQVIAITGKSYRVKEAPASARKKRKTGNQTNRRPPGPRAKARSSAPARSNSLRKSLDWKNKNDMNPSPRSGRF